MYMYLCFCFCGEHVAIIAVHFHSIHAIQCTKVHNSQARKEQQKDFRHKSCIFCIFFCFLFAADFFDAFPLHDSDFLEKEKKDNKSVDMKWSVWLDVGLAIWKISWTTKNTKSVSGFRYIWRLKETCQFFSQWFHHRVFLRTFCPFKQKRKYSKFHAFFQSNHFCYGRAHPAKRNAKRSGNGCSLVRLLPPNTFEFFASLHRKLFLVAETEAKIVKLFQVCSQIE